MEDSVGSNNVNKPWDHAWSTEEMRNNRRDWSLAADSGLLKHLEEFSENITKKASETQDVINSMASQINETSILVDNIMNTSLALANTQFIESRVQEDNIEMEQPIEDTAKSEDEDEFSASDLLVSVCESIKAGLRIMDEKYEKVEVLASDSDDDDDNAVPSIILRAKDPYQNRPLPYVIGSEQWKASNKVGLESSSSESEANDENEDSVSDIDEKNVGNVLSSNVSGNLGINRLSSTSSESNDYNNESSSIKDTDNNRLYARSQDTLNSDTEPTTPSSVLPKMQNVNTGPPSFAEELAKRLGNVLPPQKNVVTRDTNEQIVNRSKDDIFTSKDDQDVFSNKSDNLFSEGKNLFFEEISSSSTKNRSIRPINKNIIPPSIDVPPPLSMISSVPKSTIDDLFGDVDDSEDSDDIFSKKMSKDIFSGERETVRSEITNKQKNPSMQNIQNTSTITTSTPEIYDKAKGLFEEEEKEKEDDDLFTSDDKQIKSSTASSIVPEKKKPIGGVPILGKVDILSSSKFVRRSFSSSSSESDSIDHRINSNTGGINNSKSENSSEAVNVSSLEAGNNAGNSRNTFSENNTGSSSGISIRQPSIDNTAGSSLGADFQPLMTSSRLKSEEIYHEHVASDSLFSNKSKSNATDEQHQRQSQVEDVTGHEELFGPPPLSKILDSSKPVVKSKVASLFDDSDSGDDLFVNASPESKSLKSIERTPVKIQNEKKRSLFDNDDDLFGSKDAPDVDLFAAAPVKSLSKVAENLFEEKDKPKTNSVLFGTDSKHFTKNKNSSTVSSLFGETSNIEKVPKYTINSLFDESSEKVNDTKTSRDNLFEENSKSIHNLDSENKVLKQPVNTLFKETSKVEKDSEKKSSNVLFEDSEEFLESNLFSKISKSKPTISEKRSGFLGNSKSLFEDDLESDLFGSSSNNVFEKNIIEESSENLFDDLKDSTNLFVNKDTDTFKQTTEKAPPKNILEDRSKISKSKKLSTSIFDDSDEDDQDLFSGFSFSKKPDNKKTSSIFEDNKTINTERNMENKNIEKDKSADIKKKKETSIKSESKDTVGNVPKLSTRNLEKNNVFDDNEDDDDLFGSKKTFSTKERENQGENDVIKNKEQGVNREDETESISKGRANLDALSKKAILTEIKQKLEKHKEDLSEKNVKSESNAVDGAVISKKESPKTLKIHKTPLISDESAAHQQSLKKSAISGKMKNLMGKMGDLKILSPTDTPPLWRKRNDELSGNENDQDTTAELESSEASTPSPPSSESSPHASGSNSRTKDSPSSKSDNTEMAISFDEPAQVETLASITSKNRVRIQSKRRPQSRHARQSALRHSGIDFDIVDIVDNSGNDASIDQLISDYDASSNFDRLLPSKTHQNSDSLRNNPMDSSHVDDKSELSTSRNTATNLLSPSTDEEDLFDVPPDLPEDPSAKEDSLFGRAPILSPVANLETSGAKLKSMENQININKSVDILKEKKEMQEENKCEKVESIDPLRDDNHDPLKDPSQLFAFVTKTPSPDKNKGLLLNKDDDSLFSNSSKVLEKIIETKSKPTLDLFVDDDEINSSDIFSSSKRKIKKSTKDSSTDLLDSITSDDDDNGLFGSTKRKSDTKKSETNIPTSSSVRKVNQNLESKSVKSTAKDIFDISSDDEDIFASNKKPMKKKTQSLFEDDGDNFDDDIFGKSKASSTKDNKLISDNERVVTKKPVTKDLKKTAKRIVEDPLSVLQDD